ncbi:MAG: hypothetical protein J6V53_06790 [Alphaproteobacteria bacterium]|nr:hypothetical protein [Alphaproteobacteria bacterium]
MRIEDIISVLNFKNIPETFIKYEKNISLRRSVITKKELDEAFAFYELEEEKEFYQHCLNLIEEFKTNKVLKKAALLIKYISFETKDDEFLEMEYWKAKPPRADISALVLLSAVRQHKKALKGLDKKQRQHQIVGIQETILRGLKLYKINGISYGSLAWGIRFVRQLLMKFGRLQFEYSYYRDPFIVVKDKKGKKKILAASKTIKNQSVLIQPGDVCINIHIDRHGRLEPEMVNRSLALAKRDLKKYFPSVDKVVYRCHSWLLSLQMELFLTKDRHIMYFQSLFLLLPPHEEDMGDDFFRFLFNTQKTSVGFSIENLPEDTSLRRNVKKHLLEGKTVQEGRGLIFVED